MSDSARRERCPPDSSVKDSFHTSPNATRTSNPDQATSQLSMAHADAETSCKALFGPLCLRAAVQSIRPRQNAGRQIQQPPSPTHTWPSSHWLRSLHGRIASGMRGLTHLKELSFPHSVRLQSSRGGVTPADRCSTEKCRSIVCHAARACCPSCVNQRSVRFSLNMRSSQSAQAHHRERCCPPGAPAWRMCRVAAWKRWSRSPG